MDFALSEEQQAVLDMAIDFGAEAIAPHALAWDASENMPRETLEAAAALGLAAIYVPEEDGGSGLTRLDATLVFEGLAMACPSVSAFLSIHNMVAWMVSSFGSQTLKERHLADLCAMRKIASYCLTEPGSGSDADGLSFGAMEKKMGWRAQPTAQVIMENCAIDADSLLGAEGDGFRYAMMGLDGGRLNIAAAALGGAQSAYDKALAYAKDRQAFGRSIDQFQSLQFKLADMHTTLDVARCYLRQAAWKLDNHAPDATRACAMAKRYVTDSCFAVANEALQIHGGYGYLTDYGVEKIVRDLRVHQILEGTNEIMRVIISRSVMTERDQ